MDLFLLTGVIGLAWMAFRPNRDARDIFAVMFFVTLLYYDLRISATFGFLDEDSIDTIMNREMLIHTKMILSEPMCIADTVEELLKNNCQL